MDLKLIKIGNSRGVILPSNVITNYKKGDVITVNVITKGSNVITKKKKEAYTKKNVITKKKHLPFDICPKHKVFYNTCGCK